jgi:hypothetical protein
MRSLLLSKRAKGYHGREANPAHRWYALLLRDRELQVLEPWPGIKQARGTCRVRYLKIRGVDAATLAILSFLRSAGDGHLRDFDARYFLLESDADRFLAVSVRAGELAGALPISEDTAAGDYDTH